MKNLFKLFVLGMTAIFMSACSSDSVGTRTTAYNPPTALNVKTGEALSENALAAPSAPVFDREHNAVVFVSDYYDDPDVVETGVDLGNAMGQDIVP